MTKSRRVPSDQFECNAVERWIESGSPAAVIGRKLGIVPTPLPTWREKYSTEMNDATSGRVDHDASSITAQHDVSFVLR